MATSSEQPDRPRTPATEHPLKQVMNAQPETNGASTAPTTESLHSTAEGKKKQKEPKPAEAAATGDAAQPNGEVKLSNAELKKRAKEEKAARRAAEKAAKNVGGGSGVASGSGAATPGAKSSPQHQQKPGQKDGPKTPQHRRTPSQGVSGQPTPIPFRAKAAPSSAPAVKEPKRINKQVGLFGHLYTQPKRHTLEGVSKEVHPAVLALGLQMSNYVVCGSNARCVGMMLAFKKAIQSYTTPHGTSLARHMTSHHLSPQIDYLKSHRPISVSMGNAIRYLKDYIIHIDPDTPEQQAKADICAAIDNFIRERITVADLAIAKHCCSKIREGMTIVTFGKSSIVEKCLIAARDEGKHFKVVVVDSRPLFEGRNLARSLAEQGIETRYMLHTAASFALKDADLVLLGAHAMMANGRLYSRVGTAAVAMMAHNRDVPVIVCCESIKFTDRVALDSIVLNEIAPPDELVLGAERINEGATVVKPEPVKGGKGGGSGGGGGGKKQQQEEEEKKDGKGSGLMDWRDVQGLQLLNILYDVTPAEYINMVITEYGSLPPSSVPVVHRISTERDVRT